VWFDAHRLRHGLFRLLGFGVASGGPGSVMKIEMEERGMEVLLALTISGQGGFGAHRLPDRIMIICRMTWRSGWGWGSRALSLKLGAGVSDSSMVLIA
jgi:hypothetical protein